MKIDAVFSGGGVKAFAFLGALDVLKEKGYSIERVGGTSAGAILASLVAANYSIDEIKRLFFAVNLQEFLDPPLLARKYSPLKLLSLYLNKGLYKGDLFERWIAHQLQKKGIVTFAHLKANYLKVVVSDLTKGRLVVIPDDLYSLYRIHPEEFRVATAVRMSAGFPYFFIPKRIKNLQGNWSYIVDGGLLSNFPLWLFKNEQTLKRPLLGITLSETVENESPETIVNGLDMLQSIFKTMVKAHDTRYISTNDSKNIIFIPVKQIQTTDFTITNEIKSQLIKLGRVKAESFIHQ